MNELKSDHESFISRTSEDRLVQNSGLKIGKKRNPDKENSSQRKNFEEQVDNIQEYQDERMALAISLGKKFNQMIKDSTLEENKGPIQKSLETEILQSWQDFILRNNNPPPEDVETPEGYGSLAGILMSFKALIDLRNKTNQTNFRLEKISKELEMYKSTCDTLFERISLLEDKLSKENQEKE